MKREEFVKWFESTGWFNRDGLSDYSWSYEVDYSSCRCDYVYINEESVEYSWEELYWGGSSTQRREFTFEEFIEAYKNDAIKW